MSVRAKGLSVLAIPLVSLLAVVGGSLALEVKEREQRALAVHANGMTSAAGSLLANAIEAETGVRGYAGTQDPAFLEPYGAAVSRLSGDVRNLAQRVAEGSGDGAAVRSIRATVAEEFALLATIRASVQHGADVGTLRMQLKAGKVVMDRLRRQVAGFTAEPSRSLRERVAAINRLESRIVLLNVLGLGVGVLAGLIGVALFTSGVSRRLGTAADNAKRLGVGRPLTPTAPSGDELGSLAESITQAEHLLASRLTELTAARDEAVRATSAKNGFLSRTSHELRTPLNAILGFAQLLEMSDLEDDDRDSTARILEAGRHLLALINELIDIARIEAGDLRLSIEPVGVAVLVEEVTVLVQPLAAARAIAMLRDCGDAGLAAQADRQRLKQILINLLSNAVKYNRDGGTIEVACRPKYGDMVEIAVRDTGPGLSEAEIAQVFVPFERLHADQQAIEGTGIGLPLARSLTEAMHATLAVDSAPGQGSTFTVTLPRAPDIPPGQYAHPRAESVPPPADVPDDPATHIGVLSIEDNPANREVIARFLASRPGTVLHATSSGSAGIDLARQHRPAVILLDLHLPDLAGEEVFKRLRADPATAGIPVIVLSADATPGTIRGLIARGVSAYVTKPLDLSELGRAIDAAVRHSVAIASPTTG
jgi:signal transduction histidine kinase/CheY-like chemotaxis protein